MIERIFETHVKVRSLERSMDFYSRILKLELGHFDAARRIAFYWVGGANVSMLGLWEQPTGEIAPRHFAFQIAADDFDKAIALLETNSITYYNFLDDAAKQPMVFGWMPAVAIYFPDPDGNELEFIAPLPGEPRPDVGIVTHEAWAALA